MTKSNEVFHEEFIGKYVKVKDKNIEGKIIDETKNTFLVLQKNKDTKMVLKKNNIFELKTDQGDIEIDGKSILIRPEDRIKAKWK